MRPMIYAVAVEAALFGAAALNAFWHPTFVSVAVVPVMFGLLVYVVRQALGTVA